jgi:transcription initiation factor TFIID subunit TAF12
MYRRKETPEEYRARKERVEKKYGKTETSEEYERRTEERLEMRAEKQREYKERKQKREEEFKKEQAELREEYQKYHSNPANGKFITIQAKCQCSDCLHGGRHPTHEEELWTGCRGPVHIKHGTYVRSKEEKVFWKGKWITRYY